MILWVGWRFKGARYVACTANGRRMDARFVEPLLEEEVEEEGVADVRAEEWRDRGTAAIEGDSFNRFIEWLSEREQDGVAIMCGCACSWS